MQMNRLLQKNRIMQRQKGVVLAISLILLTIITLLSVTAMRSANLGTRIAVNHQHKQFAFQAAENALSLLTNLSSDDMKNLSVPGATADDPIVNSDWYVESSTGHGGAVSADLAMTLEEVSAPGQYKFSGFGLNVVTVVYQADATGKVEGVNTTAHNRMQVALIRN